jgi:hypothetical protein
MVAARPPQKLEKHGFAAKLAGLTAVGRHFSGLHGLIHAIATAQRDRSDPAFIA